VPHSAIRIAFKEYKAETLSGRQLASA